MVGHLKRTGVILAIIVATQSVSASQVPSDAEIRRILTERIDRYHQSVGIVVGVIEPEGRRVVSYGWMGMNDPRPVNGDTLYEIGSITKVFTSLILAGMVERGEVALNDPLAKYLPAGVRVPDRNGEQITLYDLATHRSGLPRSPSNFSPKGPDDPFANYPEEQLFAFLSGYNLTRDIGAKFEYSNPGVALLGNALARRAGRDFESLVRERVLVPLGMTSTGFSLSSDLKSRLAAGHTSAFRLTPAPNWNFPALAGAGALRSTANDMLTFLAANLGYAETPLASSMAAMVKSRRDVSESAKIGLGWFIEKQKGAEIVWHNGGTFGYKAFAGYDPKSRIGVLVLSNNTGGAGVDDIGRHLLNPSVPLLSGEKLVLKQRAEVSVDPRVLEAYVGRYQFPDNDIWTVRRDSSRLFIKSLAEPEFEVFPESNTEFLLKIADAQVTFNVDKDSPGRASELILRRVWENRQRGKRIE